MYLLCAATREELLALLPRDCLPCGDSLPLQQPLAVTGTRQPMLACVTGVGPVNAALGMGQVLASCAFRQQPLRGVILAGLAGSFDLQRWPLGQLCPVGEEIWPEYGLHDGHQVSAEHFAFPQWQDGGKTVFQRLPLDSAPALGLTARGDLAAPPLRSLTVAGVSGSDERAAALWHAHAPALENMEGFAVAYAAARAHLPCLEVRCVSNKTGRRAAHEQDFPGALRQLGRILPTLNLV